MSYTMDNLRVKKCKLTADRKKVESIVRAARKEFEDDDLRVEYEFEEGGKTCPTCGGPAGQKGTFTISPIGEDGSITGTVDGGMLKIEGIELQNDPHGDCIGNVVMPILKASKGIFEAVAVWESGDSIQRISSKDGEVTETDLIDDDSED